jgi:hypothetical protein
MRIGGGRPSSLKKGVMISIPSLLEHGGAGKRMGNGGSVPEREK